MDLQQEYFNRKKVPSNIICYPEKGVIYLKSKKPVEHNWLQMSIEIHNEPNHPPKYRFSVLASPTIYSSQDFTQFSYNHSKVICDEMWEWDQYELKLLEWIKNLSKNYESISYKEAFVVSWEMFVQNTDSWFANFLPTRILCKVADSLEGNEEGRFNAINDIERWIQHRYERIWTCWRNVSQNINRVAYADWLSDTFNAIGKKNA